MFNVIWTKLENRPGREPDLKQPHPRGQPFGAPAATLGVERWGGGEQPPVGWMAFDGRRGEMTGDPL